MSEKSKEYLDKAMRSLQIADHMTYVTYPLFNEKKLLLKIFDEINKCIINCISFINLRDKLDNEMDSCDFLIDNFLDKNSDYIGLNNKQIKKIKGILELNLKHKKSAMEFVRMDKVVIMADNLSIEAIDLEKIKDYLIVTKELMKRARYLG